MAERQERNAAPTATPAGVPREPGESAGRVGLRARLRARSIRRRFDPARALELNAVLETTFEPGALLVVTRTAPQREGRKSVTVVDPEAEVGRDATRVDIEAARSRVRSELESRGDPDAATIIDYIRKVRHKSPRVEYNLACYYSLAAEAEAEHRQAHVTVALEYLRKSVSRTPPLERRGLLDWARNDPDLLALRRARRRKFRKLRSLIPADDEHLAVRVDRDEGEAADTVDADG